ncbi:MAG: hypothetical protein AAF849_19325 [Bacteroidota bacterium]
MQLSSHQKRSLVKSLFMNAIQLEVQQDRYLLSIDKTAIDRHYLNRLIKLIRVEYLASKIDFTKDVEELGQDIQNDWWQENKDRLLKDD